MIASAYQIKTISIVYGLSDGTTRMMDLQNEKQDKQLAGYITHIQGGKVKISKAPVVIMSADAADRMTRDAVAYNQHGFWRRAGDWLADRAKSAARLIDSIRAICTRFARASRGCCSEVAETSGGQKA